jgi:hypothetical protein
VGFEPTGYTWGVYVVSDLFEEDTKVYEGHNRHEALLRVMDSLIKRNMGVLILEQFRKLAHEWNLEQCSPPLDNQVKMAKTGSFCTGLRL